MMCPLTHGKQFTDASLHQVEAFLAKQDDVAFAYLFGSQASKRQTPVSDIDIAVFMVESITPKRYLELLVVFDDNLKRDDIDLVILNTA